MPFIMLNVKMSGSWQYSICKASNRHNALTVILLINYVTVCANRHNAVTVILIINYVTV